MTRRMTMVWPDDRPFRRRDGRPLRLLAASDEPDPALDEAVNRTALEPIDLVIGSGDLAPDRLAFLADAFHAPLLFVRGNHDRGGPWPEPRHLPLASAGFDDRTVPGMPVFALPWPSGEREPPLHDEGAAWRQVLRLGGRHLLHRGPVALVVSHVPPQGAGDTPTDPYHRGFDAYRFVLDRLRPALWLHGHTNPAAQKEWQERYGDSTIVNVTGSVLVEILSPATPQAAATPGNGSPGGPAGASSGSGP
jgi:predicted phosphodiesterase